MEGQATSLSDLTSLIKLSEHSQKDVSRLNIALELMMTVDSLSSSLKAKLEPFLQWGLVIKDATDNIEINDETRFKFTALILKLRNKKLIKQLAQIEKYILHVQNTPIRLRQAIKDVLSTTCSDAIKTLISLNLTIDGKTHNLLEWYINTADEQKKRQAFKNILSRACHQLNFEFTAH